MTDLELIEQGILSPFQMILQFGLELRTLSVQVLLSLLPVHPDHIWYLPHLDK